MSLAHFNALKLKKKQSQPEDKQINQKEKSARHNSSKTVVFQQPRLERTVSNADKQLCIVPKMDKFAEKKKAEISQREKATEEIILCCQDVRKVNAEAIKLMQLQTKDINLRLCKKNTINPAYSNIVQRVNPPSGYLNLIYKEWTSLSEEQQDDLFETVITEIENFF